MQVLRIKFSESIIHSTHFQSFRSNESDDLHETPAALSVTSLGTYTQREIERTISSDDWNARKSRDRESVANVVKEGGDIWKSRRAMNIQFMACHPTNLIRASH